MVEIFCGILGGAHWGPHVRKWMSTAADADLVRSLFFPLFNFLLPLKSFMIPDPFLPIPLLKTRRLLSEPR